MQNVPAKPVSLQYANVIGSSPACLPIPGDDPVLGVKPPLFAGDNTRYLMPDGSVWEYLGISGMRADDQQRVNGWQKIQEATT